MNIITITPNPALDTHLESENFSRGGYNKARIIRRDSGGKGINLSRALAASSVDNSCFMMLGKEGAEGFILPLYNIGMNIEVIYTEGTVRENMNIHHGGEETVISTDGPAVSAREVAELEQRLMPLVDKDSLVALCGSISEGSDKDAFLSLLYKLKANGARLVIDSKSLSAEEIIPLKPYLIKPNESEAELLTGLRPENLSDAARIAAALRDMGCECVMLTMGELGAVLASPSGIFVASAPRVEAKSTVGAGDSSIAGFLAAIARGEDYPKALARAVAFGASACMEEGSLPPMPENISAMLDVITVKPCDIQM